MNVELKFTYGQLVFLLNELDWLGQVNQAYFIQMDRKRKNEYSLLVDCFDRIQAKLKTISRKVAILTNPGKKYSLSLKYHELTILNNMCCKLKDSLQDPREKNLANQVYILIDQKL